MLSSMYLAYSTALIGLSESMLKESLTRQSYTYRNVGLDIRGRLKPLETKLIQLNRPGNYVSESTKFTFSTPSNLLFVRFHAELVSGLREISTESIKLRHRINNRLAYHMELLTARPFNEMMDVALDPNLDIFSLLDNARSEAKSGQSLIDLLDLYESFRKEKIFHALRCSKGF